MFVWLVTGMTPMRLLSSVAVLGDGVTLDVMAAAWLRDKALSSAKSVVELMICIFGFGGRLSVLVLESGGWAFVSKGRFMGKQWILSRGVDKGHGMFTLFLHRLLVCWSYTRVAYCFTGHSADLDPVHFGVKLRPIDVIIFNNVKALYKIPCSPSSTISDLLLYLPRDSLYDRPRTMLQCCRRRRFDIDVR